MGFGVVVVWGGGRGYIMFYPAHNHLTWAAGLRWLTGRPPVWWAVRLRLLWKLIRRQITHFVSPEQSSKDGAGGDTHVCARDQTRMCSLATAQGREAGCAQQGLEESGRVHFFFLSLENQKKNLYATSWDAAELRFYWSVRQQGDGAMIAAS